jgi:hypothetical protein
MPRYGGRRFLGINGYKGSQNVHSVDPSFSVRALHWYSKFRNWLPLVDARRTLLLALTPELREILDYVSSVGTIGWTGKFWGCSSHFEARKSDCKC